MTFVQNALSEFQFNCKIVVQWGDMDAARHVNNIMYLRWTETARILFLQEMSRDVSPTGDKAGIILAWQDCKYIFPVTFPDTVYLGAKVNKVGEDSFIMETHIFSETHQRLVCISNQKLVAYNYAKLKKVALPNEMKEALIKSY